jgi:hypothetical protein
MAGAPHEESDEEEEGRARQDGEAEAFGAESFHRQSVQVADDW